ncbi:MAG: hypothetical protein J3Q66DRAFT_375191 [Benniella sp.]|nr:MAG: hypothetical protein J3Q66DRAFT_375191 [Benniella sp.]
MAMIILVSIVIIVSTVIFSALFVYLYRIHKQLQIRYQKPVPGAIVPDLEQHHELAFAFTHGVEAYSAQRRRQQRRQQSPHDDTASIQSSHPSIPSLPSEPLPAYSPDPIHGHVGWRAGGPGPVDISSSSPALPGDSTSSSHPLDTSFPPVYIYQSPTNRSTVQAALLSTDNSPTVPTAPAAVHSGRQASRRRRRRSTVSAILARRDNQRSISMTSSSSSSSDTVQPSSGRSDTAPLDPLPPLDAVQVPSQVDIEMPSINRTEPTLEVETTISLSTV